MVMTQLIAIILLLAVGCHDSTLVSGPMAPTIPPGKKVRINYAAYTIGNPKRWDIVAFNPPSAPDELWIMRVVALPGDIVDFTNGSVRINGVAVGLPPDATNIAYSPITNAAHMAVALPYRFSKRHYFVLGDNPNANDSRFWGALARTNIVGRVSY